MITVNTKLDVIKFTIIVSVISVVLSVVVTVTMLKLAHLNKDIWFIVIRISIIVPLLVAPVVSYFLFHQNLLLNQVKNKALLLSRIDHLTRTLNKHYFMELFEKEFSVSKRYNYPLALLLLDIDHFKKTNDTFGHLVGDIILREFASRINDVIRNSDLLGRFGGEEFILLLPHTDFDQAMTLAERIRKTIFQTPFRVDKNIVPISTSAGLAIYNKQIKDIKEFIDAADKALYIAKDNGRNRIETAP